MRIGLIVVLGASAQVIYIHTYTGAAVCRSTGACGIRANERVRVYGIYICGECCWGEREREGKCRGVISFF